MSKNIINRALIKIGENTISSIEQQPYGEMLGLIYEAGRRHLLSSHFWRFAIKRAKLARLNEDTESVMFPYAYALPNDYLMMKDFEEAYKQPNLNDMILSSDERYTIEGNRLLTRYEKKDAIIYICDEKDENHFLPCFIEALISWIAAEACVTIKNDLQYKQIFLAETEKYIMQAQLNNEILRDSESLPDNSWITCREICEDSHR